MCLKLHACHVLFLRNTQNRTNAPPPATQTPSAALGSLDADDGRSGLDPGVCDGPEPAVHPAQGDACHAQAGGVGAQAGPVELQVVGQG